MKNRIFVLLIIGLLLIIPSVQAQEYSGSDRFVDNIKLFFSSGDDKVGLALEIKEKEVDSAIENTKNGDTEKAVENLESAKEKLQVVQEKVSLNTVEEVKASVEETTNRINNEADLPDEFDDYILEEEKTQFTAVLTEKTYELCKELAKEDYTAMLKEELCNPDTAQPGLEKELENLKDLQDKAFTALMIDIRSCIDDPGTCNCEDVSDAGEKARCEKMIALAVKCEYKDDQEACSQIKAMQPSAESFVPSFLMNLFKEKEGMIDYNIEHSDGVPPECWNENTKPECEQYRHLKETSAKCWDDDGNFLEDKCGPIDKEPTMQESIPQCFDESGTFLEEKCGKIIIVRNEEGLINYLAEKEIENVIDKFEESSEQNTVDINGSEGQTKLNKIKQEMDQISNEIKERTYAPGTSGDGEPGQDINTVVVDSGDGADGDDGLTTVIVTDMGGDNTVAGGNNVVDGGGNTVVVDNDVAGGSNVIDSGGVDVDDSGSSSGSTGTNDVGGVDEGPGEPGVVDED